MIRRDHARTLAALLASTLAASPARAISLYSGVKTRATPAPLTGCCGAAPVDLPDLQAGALKVPGAVDLSLPALPGTKIPEAAAPLIPAEASAPTALEQAQSTAGEVAKAAQPGDSSSQAALTKTFDNGGGSGDAPSVPDAFSPDLVLAAQRAYRATGVAAGVAVRPQGSPVDDAEILARMGMSPLTNPEREQTVKDLFMKAGAQASEIVTQPVGRGRNNYYVVKKGRTDRVIVVGAHHDKVSEGRGVIDNWTGSTMMINLYQAMRDLDTEATYVFIAFAREEEGLIGSQAYVDALSKAERAKIDSMLNLDTLAVDGTFSWDNNSTPEMLKRVMAVAKAEKRDLVQARLDGGDADSSTFRWAKIPAMTLFGASQDVIFDIIHSSRDNMAAFNLDHYRNAYLLSLALLKELDKAPIGKVGRV